MIIYIDSCCYGRPQDEQTQLRIIIETIAIRGIIDLCRVAGYSIVGSPTVAAEIRRNPDAKIRDATVDFFLQTVDRIISPSADVIKRAQDLHAHGLGPVDSLHLALAEVAGADVLITVDDDFEKICTNKKLSAVRIINPLKFMQEVII
jgi:predicted nucleic acid-binding protein